MRMQRPPQGYHLSKYHTFVEEVRSYQVCSPCSRHTVYSVACIPLLVSSIPSVLLCKALQEQKWLCLESDELCGCPCRPTTGSATSAGWASAGTTTARRRWPTAGAFPRPAQGMEP